MAVMGGFIVGVYVLFALKGIIWFVVELVMYINGISKYCHGGFKTYGLILAIWNGLGVLAGVCRCCQGGGSGY